MGDEQVYLRGEDPRSEWVKPAFRGRMAGAFLICYICAVVMAGCGGSVPDGESVDGQSMVADRPNVLLITIDTLRADYLGCYGNAGVRTPVIDRLAAEGARFEFCVAHAPSTLPSHVSILTGTYPTRHGVHSNLGFRLADGFPTLAGALRASGYETGAVIGAFPLVRRFGLDQGFDLYDDAHGTNRVGAREIPERPAGDVINSARTWLKGRSAGAPWFLWAHLYDPHLPYAPPEPYDAEFRDNPYAGEIGYTDSALGELIAFLRDSGQLERTLIVITSDHGEGLGEHGERSHELFAYNSTIHVPLIMRYPVKIPAGAEIARRVRHIDIAPTILALTGTAAPETFQGVSLAPALAGQEMGPAHDSYFEALAVPLTRGWAPLRGVYHGNDKLIDLPLAEFYDMANDRPERKNLIDEAAGTADDARRVLAGIVADRDSRDSTAAENDETREKLASLGYITLGSVDERPKYGPEDDPKRLVDVHYDMEIATEMVEEGNIPRAVNLLDSIVQRAPKFVFARQYLAQVLERAGDWSLAISYLRRSIVEGADTRSLRLQLGLMLLEHNDPAAAEKEFTTLLMRDPGDSEAGRLLALIASRRGNIAAAENRLREIIARDGQFLAARHDLGLILLGRTRYDEALMQFDFIAAAEPANAGGHHGRGLALEGLRRTEEALAAHRHALELEPGLIDAHFRLGLILDHLGRGAEAVDHLRIVVEKSPEPRKSQAQNLIDRIESNGNQ